MCYWMLHNLTNFINLGNSFFAFPLYGLLSHRTKSGFVILHINSCVSIGRVGMRTWWFGGHWLLCKPLPEDWEAYIKLSLTILHTCSYWKVDLRYPCVLHDPALSKSRHFIRLANRCTIYCRFYYIYLRSFSPKPNVFLICLHFLFSFLILIGMVVWYHMFTKRLNLLGNANYWVFAHGCVRCFKELIYAIVHAARLSWSPSEFWPVLEDWFESNIFKSYLWW